MSVDAAKLDTKELLRRFDEAISEAEATSPRVASTDRYYSVTPSPLPYFGHAEHLPTDELLRRFDEAINNSAIGPIERTYVATGAAPNMRAMDVQGVYLASPASTRPAVPGGGDQEGKPVHQPYGSGQVKMLPAMTIPAIAARSPVAPALLDRPASSRLALPPAATEVRQLGGSGGLSPLAIAPNVSPRSDKPPAPRLLEKAKIEYEAAKSSADTSKGANDSNIGHSKQMDNISASVASTAATKTATDNGTPTSKEHKDKNQDSTRIEPAAASKQPTEGDKSKESSQVASTRGSVVADSIKDAAIMLELPDEYAVSLF